MRLCPPAQEMPPQPENSPARQSFMSPKRKRRPPRPRPSLGTMQTWLKARNDRKTQANMVKFVSQVRILPGALSSRARRHGPIWMAGQDTRAWMRAHGCATI